MKLTALALSFLLSATAVMAERNALIDHDDEWNMFSKFEVSSSGVDENSAIFGGLTVGGLLNDTLGLGIAAHMLIDSVDTDSLALGDIKNGDLYYGGGYLEYVIKADNLVYVSLDVLLGGGQLDVQNSGGGKESGSFYVVEPGLNLMINITETFHFGLGASYRFAGDVDIVGLDEQAMTDWSGNAFFRFTQF